jgi:hypothetical protein
VLIFFFNRVFICPISVHIVYSSFSETAVAYRPEWLKAKRRKKQADMERSLESPDKAKTGFYSTCAGSWKRPVKAGAK